MNNHKEESIFSKDNNSLVFIYQNRCPLENTFHFGNFKDITHMVLDGYKIYKS